MRPAVTLLCVLLINGINLIHGAIPHSGSEPSEPYSDPDPGPDRPTSGDPYPVNPAPAPEAPASNPATTDPEHPPLPPPKDNPTQPHAAILPAHVAPPENPAAESESESDLGDILENIADAIESVVEAFDNGAAATTTVEFLGKGVPIAATTTPPPLASACLLASEVFDGCYSATSSPDFYSLLLSDQASCLCYATVSNSWYWQPQSFDAYITSCNSYVQTLNVRTSQAAVREGISSAVGLCASAGDVRTTAVVVSGNVTAAETVTPVSVGATSTVAAATSMGALRPSAAVPASEGMARGRGEDRSGAIVLGAMVVGFFM